MTTCRDCRTVTTDVDSAGRCLYCADLAALRRPPNPGRPVRS